MENVFYNISQVLGVTVLQSLWQGLLVWFALRLLFIGMPSLSAIKKHNLATMALFTISGWFIYTFITEMQAHVWITLNSQPQQILIPYLNLHINNFANNANPAQPVNYYYVIEAYLPYISALYLSGLVFNLLRMGLSWQKIYLIKRTMIPADRVQHYVDSFCKRLNITKEVGVYFSRLTDVPCMIGYFSPIILLPITLTTYLSAEEIEAILLHELSHIKRNDYLLNLVQQFITILLFFNPFAQLINRIINQERENSCDDLVVQTTAQPLVYAHALLKLEQTRQVNLQLALAAIGKKYHLLTRIERIMKTKKPIGNIRHLFVALIIMAAGVSSIAWLNPEIKNGKLTVKKVAITAALHNMLVDTGKKATTTKSKKIIAYKKLKDKTYQKHSADVDYSEFNDAELERLTAEVDKNAAAISKFYDSPEFKEQQDALEKRSQDFEEKYNHQTEKMKLEQEKMDQDFQKDYGENAETQKTSKEMEELGKKIGAYYASTEFMQMNEKLEKKYGIPHSRYYNNRVYNQSDSYKKYQAELQSKIPEEIKAQTEKIGALGEQISKRYSSPDFVKRRDQMQAMGDSMRKVFDNPDFKAQQNDIKAAAEQMAKNQNNPEIKAAQQRLKQATKKLHDYMNSPAFKKRMDDYKAKMDAYLKDHDNYKDMNLQNSDFN